MSQQFDMFTAPATHEAAVARSTKNGPITCKDLIHSIIACHRVEDAIWQRLDIEAGSSAREVKAALDQLGAAPAWCSVEAWQRIATSMRGWATSCGNLQLYWQLRWKREK